MKYNLSEVIELMQTRRSIAPENFSDRKIQREQLEKLIQCATFAPNHKNTQPWKFHVYYENGMNILQEKLPELFPIDEIKKKERIQLRLKQTSAVILVCLNASGKVDEIEEIQAVGCAVQNMLLVAHASGFAGFWSTPKFISSIEFRNIINLNETEKCLGIIYFGYTKMNWPQSHRKPIEYVTEWHQE